MSTPPFKSTCCHAGVASINNVSCALISVIAKHLENTSDWQTFFVCVACIRLNLGCMILPDVAMM